MSDLTAGDIRSALAAVQSLVGALDDIYKGTATLSDGETIADDVLTGVAIIDPAAAPWICLGKVMVALTITAVQNGWIKPDLDPESDAQLSMGR